MPDIIQTLQLKDDPSTKVYPRIKTDSIPNAAVTTDKIADGGITEGKIESGAVTRPKIANKGVNIAKMAIYNVKWLSYLRNPTSINEFLQSVFQDYVNELVTNTLIELQIYSYNGNVYSPIQIYYDLTSTEVYVYELNDTGWELTTIDSQSQWADVYQMLNDIYITYLV